MKTKPICPVCRSESLYRDAAWWVCNQCPWKGSYPERVEIKENEVETK